MPYASLPEQPDEMHQEANLFLRFLLKKQDYRHVIQCVLEPGTALAWGLKTNKINDEILLVEVKPVSEI